MKKITLQKENINLEAIIKTAKEKKNRFCGICQTQYAKQTHFLSNIYFP